jgi:hypothetical protein
MPYEGEIMAEGRLTPLWRTGWYLWTDKENRDKTSCFTSFRYITALKYIIPGEAIGVWWYGGQSQVSAEYEQHQRDPACERSGLWDLYLDEPVVIVCEFAVAVRALGFQ